MPRSRKKQPLFTSFIDDEAADSDDGVLIDRDPESPRKFARKRIDTPDEDEPYEEDFINDGNPFDGASVVSDENADVPKESSVLVKSGDVKRDSLRTPPPSQPVRVPKTPGRATRLGKRRQPEDDDEDVIELTSDEDLEAMDEDDSMFRKPAGIKATYSVMFDPVQSFTSLTTLVLRDFHRHYYPSWTQYLVLASQCVRLVRLSIRNVGCSNGPASPADTLVFATVVEFDLFFGSATVSLSTIIVRLRFPAIRVLHFKAESESAVVWLNACSTILHSVKHFTFDGSLDLGVWLPTTFSLMPLLNRLDMMSHDWVVFRSIKIAGALTEGPGLIACPDLSYLVTSSVEPSEVRRFVERRARGKMHTVVFRRAFDEAHHREDIEWLRDWVRPRW
ncbi:hypothetical protein C8R43DRAFT_1136730 [Mycena crocata]|nr:hypothetical protein C8R43DRAFT_1136730 [Mycena crocata]